MLNLVWNSQQILFKTLKLPRDKRVRLCFTSSARLVQGDMSLLIIPNLRIFGRVEQSGTRKVSGNVEFSDIPNNPRQFLNLMQDL